MNGIEGAAENRDAAEGELLFGRIGHRDKLSLFVPSARRHSPALLALPRDETINPLGQRHARRSEDPQRFRNIEGL